MTCDSGCCSLLSRLSLAGAGSWAPSCSWGTGSRSFPTAHTLHVRASFMPHIYDIFNEIDGNSYCPRGKGFPSVMDKSRHAGKIHVHFLGFRFFCKISATPQMPARYSVPSQVATHLENGFEPGTTVVQPLIHTFQDHTSQDSTGRIG